MNSQTETSSTDLSFWTMRNLEFRVLILGRANAGKTTILERVAAGGAAVSEAEVRRQGELLPAQMIKGQSERGLHNVDDEIRFPSRPGFVFHDSRGVESGSAEELETLQQFVENRSSVTDIHEQLHAIWMCIPLDESRELFKGERAPFRWSKGAVPLIVIFTKRDGAVFKETSKIIDQITKDSPGTTVSRTAKKEARGGADSIVTNRVNELEEELRHLNDTLAFLTTSGMQERTDDTDNTCQQLIELTEESLTGPRIKTLLSAVWGRNLSKRGFWTIYWILRSNHEQSGWAVKLGSGTPGTREMLGGIVRGMLLDGRGDGRGVDYFGRFDDDDDDFFHHFGGHPDEAHITSLHSSFSPIVHMYESGLDDVELLTLAVLVLVVIRAVHAEVLLLPDTRFESWRSAIVSFLGQHGGVVQEKFGTITCQVAGIVEEIKHRSIISRFNIGGTWKFSSKEAHIFAERLTQCVDNNLI